MQVGGIEPIVQFDENAGKAVPVTDNSKRDEDVHEKWWMESLDKLGGIRKRAMVKQDKAPTELVMFSQPPLVDLAALKSYTYDGSAGIDVTVYVLDSGYYPRNSVSGPSTLSLEHPLPTCDTQEYTGMAKKPRWIFAGGQANKSVEEDLSSDGHGSCAGSKVNGPQYGVAKQVNLVIVKATRHSDDTLDGLNKILEDVKEKRLQNKAVVNFSRSSTCSTPASNCRTPAKLPDSREPGPILEEQAGVLCQRVDQGRRRLRRSVRKR